MAGYPVRAIYHLPLTIYRLGRARPREYTPTSMPELLLELGCEELPASFVRKAYEDLRDNLTGLLKEAGILDSEPVAMGTPRRLIISYPNLIGRQEDKTVEQRGPAL